ncbi:unnamed protein product [Rotaria sp. Silwood2]|nr:unnamed protein product [Rotaria sp. Silwood2]
MSYSLSLTLYDSHSLIGIWRDTKYASCMRLDYVYHGKSNYLVGLSSIGAYTEVCLTGSIVDLTLTLADGYSLCHYKGLLEISHDE